jgi:hypothetical protein
MFGRKRGGSEAGPKPDRILIGADFGLESDYTAFAVIEQYFTIERQQYAPERYLQKVRAEYALIELERLPLPTLVESITGRLSQLVTEHLKRADLHLCMDKTGVGNPIVQHIKHGVSESALTAETPYQILFVPVHITAGFHSHIDNGTWYAPREQLLSAAKGVIGTRRFKAPKQLHLAKVFETELRAMRLEKRLKKPDDPEELLWRSKEHDDTVFAVSMPLAWAEGRLPRPFTEHHRDDVRLLPPYSQATPAPGRHTPITHTPLPPG